MSCYRAGNGSLVHAFSPDKQGRKGDHIWVCDCGLMSIPRPSGQVAPDLVWASALLLAVAALGAVLWLAAWVSRR